MCVSEPQKNKKTKSLEGVVDECVGMFSDTLGYLSSRVDDVETEIMAVVDDVEHATDRIANL
jgi:hypothetical protein